MGKFSNFIKRVTSSKGFSRVELVTQNNSNFFLWGNKAYDSDTVRACVNAQALRFSKLQLKHIREIYKGTEKDLVINPEPYIKFLLEEPNPYTTMDMLLYKTSVQLSLSGNAFWLIIRDENSLPIELYLIPAKSVNDLYDDQGHLVYEFIVGNAQTFRFDSADVIHLRDDYGEHEVFGSGKFKALAPLLEITETTDRGIINAIRNSGIVKWLLKYTSALRPEDLKSNAKKFAENYLDISNSSVGVAAVDSKVDATQISPNDYVPNALQMDRTKQRILELFNTNEKIITSTADEDEENAYFDAVISPKIVQLKNELTRKLFTRRQRGCGNYIAVGSFNLQSASLKTKLNFAGMVDRGAMLPNEWRESLGLAPVPGGDTPLRRLDTVPVEGGKKIEE
jgi:HK97 family phage portal protein|nr:MAG TPA: portal protein [Caudoviricetes sp.]